MGRGGGGGAKVHFVTICNDILRNIFYYCLFKNVLIEGKLKLCFKYNLLV